MKVRYIVLLLVISGIGGFFAGAMLELGQLANSDTDSPSTTKREILYWVAPMDPNYRRDTPGKSPMGMDLVPVYEDNAPPGLIEIEPAMNYRRRRFEDDREVAWSIVARFEIALEKDLRRVRSSGEDEMTPVEELPVEEQRELVEEAERALAE